MINDRIVVIMCLMSLLFVRFLTYFISGVQGLTVTLADCLLPQLVDVLFLTDRALNIAQQFSYNMCMLKERINTYNYICS